MPRADLSKYLVHWTKGDTYNDAFEVLRRIVFERSVRGSGNAVRGGWTCVCFTEAPESTFHQVVGKYAPFGVQVPKDWLFSLGGRPVIYQMNDEYELLPNQLKWRHVRYEPTADPPIDFSWEREWRIQCNELHLDPPITRILVPDESWAGALMAEHDIREDQHIELIASVYGEIYRGYPTEPFQYAIAVVDA